MEATTKTGKRFAAVAGHPLAADTAVRTLQGGGSVVDAAIAGAAVLVVALPHACSLGGDCFALVHHRGQTFGINGSGRSPARLASDAAPAALAIGPISCAVPGVLGGWEAMHARFGRLEWRQLFEPAIELARDGVRVGSELAAAMRRSLASLRRDPGCRALFLRNDDPYVVNGRMRQPALAATLEAVAAEGARVLYEGEIGAGLCRALGAAGGVLEPGDLAAYEPEWVTPLETIYRGRFVRVMPPSSWGLYMLLQLAGLDGVPPRDLRVGSAERLRRLIGAARASFALGSRLVADPREVADALPDAFGAAAIRRLRAAIDSGSEGTADIPRSRGTAVISVADHEREGVTMVQSVFTPFGSLVADAATGIVMNNRLRGFTSERDHPNRAGPSKRPAHTLNPVMVSDQGALRLLMGTPGGSGQTLTLVQVLSNVVDHGMDLAAAITAPRWSMDLEGNALLEPEIGAETARELAALGVETKFAPEQRHFFGSAECIAFGGSGLTAVADFRRDAGAAAA